MGPATEDSFWRFFQAVLHQRKPNRHWFPKLFLSYSCGSRTVCVTSRVPAAWKRRDPNTGDCQGSSGVTPRGDSDPSFVSEHCAPFCSPRLNNLQSVLNTPGISCPVRIDGGADLRSSLLPLPNPGSPQPLGFFQHPTKQNPSRKPLA